MKLFGGFQKDRKTAPGELLSHGPEENTYLISGEEGALSLSSPLDKVVRIRSGRGGVFSEDRSFAVDDREGKYEPRLIEENQEKVEVGLSGMRLVVSKKPVSVSAYSGDSLLFRDLPGSGLEWTGNGVWVSHIIESGSRYYGFGEKTGPLDKRGKSMTMWNTDMPYPASYDPIYVSIPFTVVMIMGRAHGLFFDNPCRSRFLVGSQMHGVFNYSAEGGELDLYLIDGPSVRGVVERFTELTGRPPMPPRFSLGHQQCRWSYMNEKEVREIADNFRKRDIPNDVIYLDIHYMDRYRVFTLNKERFPDMKKLSDDLGKQGFKLVVAIDPGVAVAKDYQLYREGHEKGYFCKDRKGREFHSRVWPGKVAFPDFSKDEVCEWWGRHHKILLDNGISGVWNDMNEPSCWAADLRLRDMVLPFLPVRRPKMVHDDGGRDTPHLCFRNVYGLREVCGCMEGMKELQPGKRSFIVSRAGYAGIQRYAAVWTGDNSSTFSHLRLSLPMLMNLGLSGVSFIGPDIGGFMWNCSPELYARWIQLGAFYPFCRTHTAIRTRRQEPWSFGERVEKIAREYIKLRYRLHPTLYSLMHESHETGAPVLRPLFFEFQDDRTADGIEDQCMFGPWLMLAPVMKKGKTQREVYLPDALWTDYWTGERIQGPKVVSRNAPLELLPLYVREGAILFKQPVMSRLDERPVERLLVELWPSAHGETTSLLYEDDGASDDYLSGDFAKRRFSVWMSEGKAVVRIWPKEGAFEPSKRKLMLKTHLQARPAAVFLNDKELEVAGESKDEKEGSAVYITGEKAVRMTLPDDQERHEINIRL